jgi:hypothetical protein
MGMFQESQVILMEAQDSFAFQLLKKILGSQKSVILGVNGW